MEQLSVAPLSEEEARLFRSELRSVNYRRARVFLPFIVPATTLVCLWNYYAMVHINPLYVNLLTLHLVYLAVLAIIWLVDICARKKGTARFRTPLLLGMIISTGLMFSIDAALNTRLGLPITSLIVGLAAIAATMVQPFSIALLFFPGIQATFAWLTYASPEVPAHHLSLQVEASIQTVVCLVISRIVYHSHLTQFTYRRKLERLTENLESQVELRTQQLVAHENMATLGMHAAQLVHNLKSPLQILRTTADSLSEYYSTEPRIEFLKMGIARLENIIRGILTPSQQRNNHGLTDVPLNEILRQELRFLRASEQLLNRQVEVVKHWEAPDTLKVRIQPSLFSQCIANIYKNALEAMVDSQVRTLTIRTAKETSPPGAWQARIEISDTGHGIKEEHLPRVFEPFFTTREPGANVPPETMGTGLGLPFCRQVVNACGGTIRVESRSGQGTCFILTLPVSAG